MKNIIKFINSLLLFFLLFIFTSFQDINFYYKSKNTQIYYSDSSKNFLNENEKKTILGGKAYNLEAIQSICEINVPNWFCITSNEFESFLKNNPSLNDLIEELDKLRQTYHKDIDPTKKKEIEKKLFELGKNLQNKIINLAFLDEFEEAVLQNISIISDNTNFNKYAYVVRSSATIEDSDESSFAGLFDSYLNLKSSKDVFTSIKLCYASVFNDRVLEHCLYNNISIKDCKMAVVVQKMIKAVVSGTAFNLDVSNNCPVISIMSNYGIGSIVEGDTSGDNYIINPTNLNIIKRTLGQKSYFNNLNSLSGIKKEKIPENIINEFSLSIEQAKEIAKGLLKIKDYMESRNGSKYIDTEFAVDEDNKVYFVQTRPLVMNNIKTAVIDTEKQNNLKKLLVGKYSVSGISSGKVKIVESFSDLESGKIVIGEEDILVAHRSTNYFTPYLTKFKGIVTIEGNPTAHPILIARERGIPCVIGVENAIEKLRPYEGQYITLDGSKKIIYLGKLDESNIIYKEIDPKLNVVSVIEKPNEEKIIEDLLIRNRLKKDYDGYWLINPKGGLSGPLLDIQKRCHSLRIEQINKATHNVSIQHDVKVRIYDDQVYVYWEPYNIQLSLYDKMNIEDCETFLANYEKAVTDYINICDELPKNPSIWNEYVNKASDMYGYMWQAYLFKLYVNMKTSILANYLNLPVPYFEEICSDIQKKFIEEDSLLKKRAAQLLIELKELCFANNITIDEISLENIKKNFKDFYDKLIKFSKEYKFSQSDDFYQDPPINQAFYVIKSISDEYLLYKPQEDNSTEYLYDSKELYRWIYVGLRCKLVNNNAHQIRMRGVWKLKDFLLPYGEKLKNENLIKSDVDILKMSSKEIEKILNEK